MKRGSSGDLMNEDDVLEFLTSLDAMELPDQIEEVNAKILDKIVEEQPYVAVFFCECCLPLLVFLWLPTEFLFLVVEAVLRLIVMSATLSIFFCKYFS